MKHKLKLAAILAVVTILLILFSPLMMNLFHGLYGIPPLTPTGIYNTITFFSIILGTMAFLVLCWILEV